MAAYSIPVSFHSVAWVFGWSGGKELVKHSYAAAEVKEHELKEQRAARRATRPPDGESVDETIAGMPQLSRKR